ELRHRDVRPGGRRDEDAPQARDVLSEVAPVADVDRIALATLDRRRHGVAADRGRHDRVRVVDGDAVAGERVPVQDEVDVVSAGGTLGEDVSGPGDVAERRLELFPDPLDDLQIRAEDL